MLGLTHSLDGLRWGLPYGPTFHPAGGRGGQTIGTKRTILVEILGLPLAAGSVSAGPHDVQAARELLPEPLDALPRLDVIIGDRAYRGLRAMAARRGLKLDVKAPPGCVSAFTPLWPLWPHWRRLSRCYEGTEASATAWLEVAAVGYLAWHLGDGRQPRRVPSRICNRRRPES